MVTMPQVGDLVHVPQAVQLIDHSSDIDNGLQLPIPLRVTITEVPTVGVVTALATPEGYVRVFCDGGLWSVRRDNLYHLRTKDEL